MDMKTENTKHHRSKRTEQALYGSDFAHLNNNGLVIVPFPG